MCASYLFGGFDVLPKIVHGIKLIDVCPIDLIQIVRMLQIIDDILLEASANKARKTNDGIPIKYGSHASLQKQPVFSVG